MDNAPFVDPSLAKPLHPANPNEQTHHVAKKKWYILGTLFMLLLATITFILIQKEFSAETKQQNKEITEKKKTPVHALIGNPKAPIRLVYAIHWTEPFQTDDQYDRYGIKSKGLKHYLEEYVALHPNVAFQLQVINYNDYAKTLQLLHDGGVPPDIYQIYSPWGASYVKNNVLDTPPSEIVSDIQSNYVSNAGATINGKIWGFPTEVNTYALVYNKDLFKKAGIISPPTTFEELVNVARKTTTHDKNGNIEQYGIAFLKGNDWQVVDPFLAWLYSNDGQYFSSDLTKPLFDSPRGKEVLEAELRLFSGNVTDNNANFFDFGKGKVAMVISPPWTKAIFQNDLRDKFASTVGVAPLPYFQKPTTLQYSWFMGVTAKSNHKKEAWEFLKWFNTAVLPETNTTRYGDLLANTIGAIPSRKIDLDNHTNLHTDPFTKVFVEQIKNSVSEPNILNADLIKKTLMNQIEAAWSSQKNPDEALRTAATEVMILLPRQ